MSEGSRTWDAIVIGSGLGGLAAAAAFAKAGKRVLVLERAANFGGAATVWRHGRLTQEASLHEMDGGEIFSEHGALRQLGVADTVIPIATDLFYEARSKIFPGDIRVPYGLSEARDLLGIAFPDARRGLDRYFASLGRLQQTLHELQDLGQRGPGVVVPMLFSGRLFELIGEMRMTTLEGLAHFFGAHEPVKLALSPHLMYLDDDPARLSFLGYAAVTSQYLVEGGYYLEGGSRALTMALLGVIKDAGGEARHLRLAREVLLDAQGRAAGVRHAGPGGEIEEDFADQIFGNAAPQALAQMLPEARRGEFLAPYESLEPSISLFSVSLGLDRPAADFGLSAYTTFIYPDWMERLDQYPISADVFGGAPGAALPLYGVCDYSRLKTGLGGEGDLHSLTLTGVDRLWAWEGYGEAEDQARREAWVEAFVKDLDARFPGLGGAVRQAEMATSRTLRARLGTPHGEAYGFRPTPHRLFGRAPSPRTSVGGLWLSSAYTVSGGYAGAMHGGLLAARAALGEARRGASRARRSIVFG